MMQDMLQDTLMQRQMAQPQAQGEQQGQPGQSPLAGLGPIFGGGIGPGMSGGGVTGNPAVMEKIHNDYYQKYGRPAYTDGLGNEMPAQAPMTMPGADGLAAKLAAIGGGFAGGYNLGKPVQKPMIDRPMEGISQGGSGAYAGKDFGTGSDAMQTRSGPPMTTRFGYQGGGLMGGMLGALGEKKPF